MKNKGRKTIAALLALVCICAAMLALAACNDDDKPTNYSRTTTQMYGEIKQKLQDSMDTQGDYGIDIYATLKNDDRTQANDDSTYKISFTGDMFALPENNSTFLLKMTRTKGDVVEDILGVGYEDGASPYLYINVAGGGYEKINGFSLAALSSMNQNADSLDMGGIDVESVLVNALFGASGTVRDGVYTFSFDLVKALESLRAYIPFVEQAAGISINNVIATLFGHLTYAGADGAVTNVSNYDTLVAYVRKTIGFAGDIKFVFNGDTFESANAQFDCKKNGSVENVYVFNLEKFNVGATDVPYNALNGLAVNVYDAQGTKSTTTDRASVTAKNLLNFAVNGTAKLIKDATDDANEEVLHYYSIEVNSDIDPFKLLALRGAEGKDEILEIISSLGYIDISVDETDAAGTVLSSVMRLHSNFAEGSMKAYIDGIDFVAAGMFEVRTEIGGQYDFDALYDIIAMLNPDSARSGDSGSGDSIDLKNIIQTILDFSVMSGEGVDIRISELINKLCSVLQLGDGMGSYFTPIVADADTMRISVTDTEFGKCKKVATSSVVAPSKSGIVVKDIDDMSFLKATPEIPVRIEEGDTFISHGFMSNNIRLSFIDLADMSEHSAYVLGISGFDASVAGVQNVTLYLGFGTELLTIIEFMYSLGIVDISPLVPLFGVQAYTVSVEVLAYDPNATVSSDSEQNLTTVIGSNSNTGEVYDRSVYDLIGTYSSGGYNVRFDIQNKDGLRSYTKFEPKFAVYDSMGTDVTKTVMNGNLFTQEGEYTLRVFYSDRYYFERNVSVVRYSG